MSWISVEDSLPDGRSVADIRIIGGNEAVAEAVTAQL